MNTHWKFWHSILIAITVAGCSRPVERPSATGQSESSNQKGFVTHTYCDRSGNETKFVVFVPSSYDRAVACPTILFLHGAGQIGSDGQAQVRGGLGDAIRAREGTFPFLTVFPQSRLGSWSADSPDGQNAMAILDRVGELYNSDRQRTYLTGYSMGGEGTWSLAASHTDRFAAIIPICPSSQLAIAPRLKDMPCWCFQGDADATETLARTRKMLLAIKAAGGQPMYEEYPGVEHNCWDITYRNEDVFEWLLLHKLR